MSVAVLDAVPRLAVIVAAAWADTAEVAAVNVALVCPVATVTELGTVAAAETPASSPFGLMTSRCRVSQPVESADPKDVSPPVIKGVAKDDKGNVYKVAF